MGKFLFAGDFCGCKRTLAVLENRNYSSLFEEVKSLTEKLREISDAVEGDIPNRKPPHY